MCGIEIDLSQKGGFTFDDIKKELIVWGQPVCDIHYGGLNIQIRGNSLSIQNQVPGGQSYGIVAYDGATTDATISDNTIAFDTSGGGLLSFCGITMSSLNNATISNNTVEPSFNRVSGTGVTLLNNRHPDGTHVPGL